MESERPKIQARESFHKLSRLKVLSMDRGVVKVSSRKVVVLVRSRFCGVLESRRMMKICIGTFRMTGSLTTFFIFITKDERM